jgi:hypothetical protein
MAVRVRVRSGARLHQHRWVRVSGSLSLFQCACSSCAARAICPGCINSLDAALKVPSTQLQLYWCSQHS